MKIYNRKDGASMAELLSQADSGTTENKRNALANGQFGSDRVLGSIDANYARKQVARRGLSSNDLDPTVAPPVLNHVSHSTKNLPTTGKAQNFHFLDRKNENQYIPSAYSRQGEIRSSRGVEKENIQYVALQRPPASHHFTANHNAALQKVEQRLPSQQFQRPPPYALADSVAPARSRNRPPMQASYEPESPRSRRKRERDQRIAQERKELQSMQSYDPFGQDRRSIRKQEPVPQDKQLQVVDSLNGRQKAIIEFQRKQENAARYSPAKPPKGSPKQEYSPTQQRGKITNLHDQISQKEAEKRYSAQMSYAEELQMQMEEKKRKEKEAKIKQQQEDMAQEKRIKEEIEMEKEMAEQKKEKDKGELNGGKVQFSPVVSSNKTKNLGDKGSKMARTPTKQSPPPGKVNPITYNIKPQNEQIWQKQMELDNMQKRQNQSQYQSVEDQLKQQLDRLQKDMNDHKNKYQQHMDDMRKESAISFEQQFKMMDKPKVEFDQQQALPQQPPRQQSRQLGGNMQSNVYSKLFFSNVPSGQQNEYQDSNDQNDMDLGGSNNKTLVTDSQFIPFQN